MLNIIIFILIFLIYFYRGPNNISRLPMNKIVSPSYGTVTYSKNNKISIFLSPLDIHVQYVPINSIVEDIMIVNKNNYYLANTPKSKHNYGVKVTFNSIYGKIHVIQRVGFFARRIINRIKKDDNVKRGYIYGVISFGSRVDIELPSYLNNRLKVGDKLIGGITPLI